MVFQQFRVSGAVFTYGTQKPHPLFCADFRLVLRAPALVAESLSLYPFPEACRSLHLNSKLSPNPSNREVWTINVYPYFDPGNHLDPGSASKCNQSLAKALCMEPTCLLPATTLALRKRITLLTKKPDDPLWITETGWSYPQAGSLPGANPFM
ncbi:unnamed protein product, partial [Symbiodinium sp. KB8]